MEKSPRPGDPSVGSPRGTPREAESTYAWLRLAVTLLLSTIGGVGMWSVVVALPAVQQEFAAARGDASLPYTLIMVSVYGSAATPRCRTR